MGAILAAALTAAWLATTALANGGGAGTLPETLPVVVAAERLALPLVRPPARLSVDPLGARLVIHTSAAPLTAARLRPLLGSLCPIAGAEAGLVVLRCRTRRLDAELVFEKGRAFLDIRALRGLPYRGADQKFATFYDPALLIDDRCPGTTPVARGECALATHQPNEAALQFRLAIGGPQHAWAAMRLGDLALAANDVVGALRWYLRAGSDGPFGRLALVRRCELTGSCLSSSDPMAFRTAALPEPIASEISLRAARADAFEGRVQSSIDRLGGLLAGQTSREICARGGILFCRRLLLELLERADDASGRAAVETYLAMPDRLDGPLALEMARAAADRAAAVGAPVFGGNVMSSVFRRVDADGMGEYLLRTTELFAAGRDWARARVIADYAESRLTARQMSDARWLAFRARLHDDGDSAAALSGDQAARIEDLVRESAAELARSQAFTERARAISGAPALVRSSQ
ncbi:MAG: hypothetical protein ABUS79_14380, partial [Pseudomonadota bacterium]